MPRRSQNKGRRPATRKQIQAIRSDLEGKSFSPPNDPPLFVLRPWFHTTVERVVTTGDETGVQFTMSDLKEALYSTVSLDGLKAEVEIRIASYMLWNNIDASDSFIRLQPRPMNQSGYTTRTTIDDSAGRNHFACVGYKLNRADYSFIHRLDSDSSFIIFDALVPPKSELLLRVKVSWRVDTGPPPMAIQHQWSSKA